MKIKSAVSKKATPYLFILPTFITLLIFSLYPLVSGIAYAFTDIKFVGGTAEWVGLENFNRLFSKEFNTSVNFFTAFRQNILWTISVVGGQLIVGYITALLLNQKLPGRGIFRVLIMLPWAIPSVVMALTWQWLYDPFFGLINYYLKALGIISEFNTWVGQPQSTIWPLVIVGIWRGIPFMSLMLLSGLQSIPDELYDAAKVDGASELQRFRFVTLPLMRPVTVVILMLSTMWWWNSFDIQRIMSPVLSLGYNSMTLPILSWYEAFQWKHLGRGAAISVISLLVMFVFILFNARRELKGDNQI